MKKKKVIVLVGVCALVGGIGYYGLTRKEIADRVIVKLAGVPRIHGFKNNELLIALDITVVNPSESGFSMSRPFVMVEVLDFLDNPTIVHTDTIDETISIARLSTQKIENIMIGLPLTIFPNNVASFVAGAIPALQKSLESWIRPLDMTMTIRTQIDGFFNIEIKEKYSFNVKEMGEIMRNGIKKIV